MAANLATIGKVVTSKYLNICSLENLDSDYNSFVSFISILMRSNKVIFENF